jgi:hypothetical protein
MPSLPRSRRLPLRSWSSSKASVAAAEHERSLSHEWSRRLATPGISFSLAGQNVSREFAAPSGGERTPCESLWGERPGKGILGHASCLLEGQARGTSSNRRWTCNIDSQRLKNI